MRPSLVLMLLLALGMPARSQELRFSTEGKFQEPGQSSRPGDGETVRTLAPGPIDVISYSLALRLEMTDAMLGGRMTMRLMLTEPADSIRLNAAVLSLDTVRVDGSVAPIAEYPQQEEFAIPLGLTRSAADTVIVEISYRRLPGLNRPSRR